MLQVWAGFRSIKLSQAKIAVLQFCRNYRNQLLMQKPNILFNDLKNLFCIDTYILLNDTVTETHEITATAL